MKEKISDMENQISNVQIRNDTNDEELQRLKEKDDIIEKLEQELKETKDKISQLNIEKEILQKKGDER
jgi:epoxyqueuosine reductase QueG